MLYQLSYTRPSTISDCGIGLRMKFVQIASFNPSSEFLLRILLLVQGVGFEPA